MPTCVVTVRLESELVIDLLEALSNNEVALEVIKRHAALGIDLVYVGDDEGIPIFDIAGIRNVEDTAFLEQDNISQEDKDAAATIRSVHQRLLVAIRAAKEHFAAEPNQAHPRAARAA